MKKKRFQKRRSRIFIHEDEIQRVLQECDNTTHPIRNRLLLLMTYYHGFRAGEVCNLKWTDIDFNNKTIFCKRQKGGVDAYQPIDSELEWELLLEHKKNNPVWSEWVFVSQWKERFEPQNFYRLTVRLGKMAGFDFVLTPHMLRHSLGTFLVNQDVPIMIIKRILGHARVSSTELYTHLAANKIIGVKKGSIFA
jgi:type 1 fimbriae regulatory protein FimB